MLLTQLYVHASVSLYAAAGSVPAADPYAPRCDLSNMVDPFVGFLIGEVKGLLPKLIYVVLFLAAVAALVFNKRIQKEGLRKAVIAIAVVVLIGSLWDFGKSVSGNAC